MNKSYDKSSFKLSCEDFGKEFVWGVATAAYQIEGGYNKDNKGPSIWDCFSNKENNIYLNQNANISCDFYHRYQEDLSLMKSLHFNNFRLSLSWARIIPKGTGQINQKGIDFYNRVIDYCFKLGITPWITLYHWDLPQSLEAKGGWTNRDIIGWFGDYADICSKHFGDRVKNWMILNEPMVFTGAGYFLGIHAPGKKGLKNFLPATHHAVLCQAEGGRILRSLIRESHIGTTFSCSEITPFSKKTKDINAARKVDALLNRLYIEPSLGLGYPLKDLPLVRKLENIFKENDDKNMKFDFDFIGIQNYTREVVRHSYTVPYIQAKIIKANTRKVKTTQMNWEVYPPSIYNMIVKYNKYKGIRKIIITENGAAFPDIIIDGKIHDRERLEYFQSYLKQIRKAQKEGLGVAGYFAWTFTDNFEWAEGYYPRFGLVYVDFKSQKRTVKTSGRWFQKFLEHNH